MSNSVSARTLAGAGIIGVLVVAFLLFGGGQISGILSTVGSSVGGGGVTVPGADTPANPAPKPPAKRPASNVGGGSTAGLYDIHEADLLIIKTGALQLQVAGLDAALAEASGRVGALGGYVSGSERRGEADNAAATVLYRLPAARWDEALVALRSLGSKVLGEETKTEDVTAEVVDLGARISNLHATEQALQAIMTKATKISDVLDVQSQLTDVRGEIEQLTAQRKHLQEQAAYSTLTVTYSLREQAVLATTESFDPGSEVDRASARFVHIVQKLATIGIWFGIAWLPFLLGLAVIGGIGVVVGRRIRRDRIGPGPMLPTPTGGSL
jgi:hypothetical protein